MEIYKVMEFAAAHRILAKGYEGKCRHLHGHNYKVEVWIEGTTLNKFGMITDFSNVKDVVMTLDHQYLNDIVDKTKPTAENIAKCLWAEIMQLSDVHGNKTSLRVRVWETSTSYAEYSGV